jgi:hypothetical protein
MRLLNFSFAERFESVVLTGPDIAWDLHNWANFQGIRFNPGNGSLDLQWAPASDSKRDNGTVALGSDAPVSEFQLVFKDVRFLRMLGPEGVAAFPENEATLHGASFVRSGDLAPGLRLADSNDEDFHLFLEFTSGRTLEIGAETGEFVLGDR